MELGRYSSDVTIGPKINVLPSGNSTGPAPRKFAAVSVSSDVSRGGRPTTVIVSPGFMVSRVHPVRVS